MTFRHDMIVVCTDGQVLGSHIDEQSGHDGCGQVDGSQAVQLPPPGSIWPDAGGARVAITHPTSKMSQIRRLSFSQSVIVTTSWRQWARSSEHDTCQNRG